MEPINQPSLADLAPNAVRAISKESAAERDGEYPARTLRWVWYPLFAALMIALGALAYPSYIKWVASRAPAPMAFDAPPLALQVERRENDLRVSWNRNIPAVNHVKKAVLWIRDGDSKPRELHLDLDQLHNGSVLYSTANSIVQFRLEVTAADNTKRNETIVALRAARADLASGLADAGDEDLDNAIRRLRQALSDSVDNPRFIEPIPRHGYPSVAAVERNVAQAPTAAPVVQLSSLTRSSSHAPAFGEGGVADDATRLVHRSSPAAESHPAAGSSTRSRKAFTPPRSNRDFDKPVRVVLVDPPAQAVSAPWEVFDPLAQVAVAQPGIAPPPVPAPQHSATVGQANATQPSGVTAREPDQPPAGPAYVSPRPVRKSLPNLHPDIRRMVTYEVEVQVKVQIDESGRVVRADTMASTGPLSSSLMSATRNAALLWRFAPAMRGNQPVASEMVLKFRYHPKTSAN